MSRSFPSLREGTGADPSTLDLPKAVSTWTETRGSYFRIHDHALFPSLKDTDLLFLDGPYQELVPRQSRC
jgi:hypothetical protein